MNCLPVTGFISLRTLGISGFCAIQALQCIDQQAVLRDLPFCNPA